MYGVIKVIDGDLYQWDTGRKVIVTPRNGLVIDELHFTNKHTKDTLKINLYKENGMTVGDIPNILLQEPGLILVHCIEQHDSGDRTVLTVKLGVIPRKRPSDYVYTETDVYNYKSIEERLGKIEEKLSSGVSGVSPNAIVTQTSIGATITITDINGTTVANVLHGKDGNDGKSAYECAKDYGYTGTEEEFSTKLATSYATESEVKKLSEDIAVIKNDIGEAETLLAAI